MTGCFAMTLYATPATDQQDGQLAAAYDAGAGEGLEDRSSAVRTQTTQKSIQYMYEGIPTTQSGSFQMSTISLSTAFEGMGDANSGYRSKTFEKFVNSLAGYRSIGRGSICWNCLSGRFCIGWR